MNVITASILPTSSTTLRGCLTRSCRSVPRLYSLAVCAAAMPNATMPSSMVARVTPTTRPFGRASCGSDGSPPPSPVRVRVGEQQDHEGRGRRGEAEEGGKQQGLALQLRPFAGERGPGHLIAPISWPGRSPASSVPVSAKNARSRLLVCSASWRSVMPLRAASRFRSAALRPAVSTRTVASAGCDGHRAAGGLEDLRQPLAVRVVLGRDEEVRFAASP